jgi:hypothetical protein
MASFCGDVREPKLRPAITVLPISVVQFRLQASHSILAFRICERRTTRDHLDTRSAKEANKQYGDTLFKASGPGASEKTPTLSGISYHALGMIVRNDGCFSALDRFYRTPLVDGIPVCRGSISTAIRNARANALNTASMM